MVTAVWLSSAVENTWLFLVGIVVLRSINRVNTPPSVSMPSDSGVTSREENVLHLALQHAGLDRGADGDDLVRVHTLRALLAEELLHRLDDLRHAGHAAHENDLVDLASGNTGILQRRAARIDGLLDEVVNQSFQLGAGELQRQMLRTRSIGGDEGQVDFGLGA